MLQKSRVEGRARIGIIMYTRQCNSNNDTLFIPQKHGCIGKFCRSTRISGPSNSSTECALLALLHTRGWPALTYWVWLYLHSSNSILFIRSSVKPKILVKQGIKLPLFSLPLRHLQPSHSYWGKRTHRHPYSVSNIILCHNMSHWRGCEIDKIRPTHFVCSFFDTAY